MSLRCLSVLVGFVTARSYVGFMVAHLSSVLLVRGEPLVIGGERCPVRVQLIGGGGSGFQLVGWQDAFVPEAMGRVSARHVVGPLLVGVGHE